MATRRFTLLDAMVLIAAIGVGVWMGRLLMMSNPFVTSPATPNLWKIWIGASYLVLLGVSLGLAVVRVFPPRPPLRRVARQPGALAMLAVVAIVAVGTVCSAIDWYVFWEPIGPAHVVIYNWLYTYLFSIGGPWNVAFAVSLAWIMGGVQGFRWRRADWIEYASRAVGAVWVSAWGALILLRIIGAS